MFWILVAVASYVLLAVAALIDKFLLSGQLGDPKIYAFYVGILSAIAFLLLPFGFWASPDLVLFLIGVAAGAAQIYGCYFYLSALKRFEASRAVPLIGSLIPIFGFFLTAVVSGGRAVLDPRQLLGFFLLITGGWLVMAKGFSIKKNGLGSVFAASLLFALAVVLAKLVYLRLPFLPGFLITAFGSTGAAMTFLFSASVRDTVFGAHSAKNHNQPNLLFFTGQGMGGAAFLLQNLAVWLAPQASVPVVNAIAGVQYAFIFLFSITLSAHFPSAFKEKTAPADIFQKTLAIILIIFGLAIFTLN